jgi:NAD(P)-dependent dehydrogenase (short-subunit alcohol dehydrogenase family)
MEELRGRTALVTGASGGIGGAIATAYARRGMHVAVHYLANEAAARETLARMKGGGHHLVQADVAAPEQVRRMVAETVETFGRLDVLVNNAGIYEVTPFDTPDFAEWQAGWKRTLDTNLMSAAHATFCALPTMKAHGGGKVINVASRSAFRAETDAPAYAVSKAGMVNLTRCLARAEARNGILSYCIAPGWVETAMTRAGMAQIADEILAQIPLGRIATVEDVAGVAVFLASDAANYLTGVTVDVNGGSYLH